MYFHWQCPYCGHHSTITAVNFKSDEIDFTIVNALGKRRLQVEWIVCPNASCKNFVLQASLFELNRVGSTSPLAKGDLIRFFRLVPSSYAKSFPDYIPAQIKADYEEACAILNLSPKASATLARRCLQGMIRDFWNISKPRLIDEINALQELIDPLTWKSIDAVRKIGNIGAHMEKDINLVIDVESHEAAMLINLIEILLKEWYIHRYEREQQLNNLIGLSTKKDEAKKVTASKE